jgi:tRNA threonylcarbamoyladenosine biosynthesis protein TsaE
MALGSEFVSGLRAGDTVLFTGELGAGKTTMIRGMLRGLGFVGGVRSPTFNLLQTFETEPPVLHADLYRLKDARGVGLEDYLETHLCLIEWPDRLNGLLDAGECYRVEILPHREGREISVIPPTSQSILSP